MNEKWDLRFLRLAKEISTWSKDPSSKIGAVIVDPETRRILSTGYNGFPRGIKDDDRLLNRDEKYPLIVHAEKNAIYNATWNGVSLKGSTIYVTGLPVCSGCALGIIQVGITRVVCSFSDGNELWDKSFVNTMKYFEEANIVLSRYNENLL